MHGSKMKENQPSVAMYTQMKSFKQGICLSSVPTQTRVFQPNRVEIQMHHLETWASLLKHVVTTKGRETRRFFRRDGH